MEHGFNVTAATRVRGADGKTNTVRQSFSVGSVNTRAEAEKLIRRRLEEYGFTVVEVSAAPAASRPIEKAQGITTKRGKESGRRGGFFGFR